MTETNWEGKKQNALMAKNQKEQAESELATKKAVLDEKIAMLTKAFEASNAELIQTVAETKESFDLYDGEIRSLAIEHFNETGEKQMGFGISVRVNTAYEYDEQKAVEYAIAHKMPHLLKVDGTKFKKFASITPIDFVETKESPSAAISYSKD